jgi:ribosomal protein L19
MKFKKQTNLNFDVGDFVRVTQLRESSIEYLYTTHSKQQSQSPNQLNFRNNKLDNSKKWDLILTMIHLILTFREYNKINIHNKLPKNPSVPIEFSQDLVKTFEGNIIAIKHLTTPMLVDQSTGLKKNLALLSPQSFWKTSYAIKVRNVVKKVGTEKTFLIDSPWILSLDVLKKSHVRRSKLYYLRRQPNRKLKENVNKI